MYFPFAAAFLHLPLTRPLVYCPSPSLSSSRVSERIIRADFPAKEGENYLKTTSISGALVAVSGASGGSDFSLLCKTILHTTAESLGVLRKVQPSGIQRRNRSVGEEVPCRPEEESKNLGVTERRKKERIAEQILLLLLSLYCCALAGERRTGNPVCHYAQRLQ